MKKLLNITLIAIICFTAASAFAAPKAAENDKIVTTTFITDIDCESCSKKIMNSIPFQKGVKDVVVDIPKKRVSISYDIEKNSVENLIKSLNKLKIKASVEEKR